MSAIDQELEHNTPAAFREKYPRGVLVVDNTYVYVEHARQHNDLQRDTWSDYHQRNEVKIACLTAPNGRIMQLYGPFSPKITDAAILDFIILTGLGGYLRAGDVDIGRSWLQWHAIPTTWCFKWPRLLPEVRMPTFSP